MATVTRYASAYSGSGYYVLNPANLLATDAAVCRMGGYYDPDYEESFGSVVVLTGWASAASSRPAPSSTATVNARWRNLTANGSVFTVNCYGVSALYILGLTDGAQGNTALHDSTWQRVGGITRNDLLDGTFQVYLNFDSASSSVRYGECDSVCITVDYSTPNVTPRTAATRRSAPTASRSSRRSGRRPPTPPPRWTRSPRSGRSLHRLRRREGPGRLGRR